MFQFWKKLQFHVRLERRRAICDAINLCDCDEYYVAVTDAEPCLRIADAHNVSLWYNDPDAHNVVHPNGHIITLANCNPARRLLCK